MLGMVLSVSAIVDATMKDIEITATTYTEGGQA